MYISERMQVHLDVRFILYLYISRYAFFFVKFYDSVNTRRTSNRTENSHLARKIFDELLIVAFFAIHLRDRFIYAGSGSGKNTSS